MTIRCGVVKSYSPFTKYGFIGDPSVDGDVHVHLYAVEGRRSLQVGQRVVFEMVKTAKGFRAQKVKVL